MLVAFTGAGISVASGLPTFEGNYRDIPVREILERDFFFGRTAFFYSYYRDVLMKWSEADPNSAHAAIARAGCPVVTQNIDGLHQRAGSPEPVELHGNLRELVCQSCNAVHPSRLAFAVGDGGVPSCPDCRGMLKPNVVLFGEGLPNFGDAVDIMEKADVILVVGTSLLVYPAAGLVDAAKERGAKVVVINAGADTEVPKWLEGNGYIDG